MKIIEQFIQSKTGRMETCEDDIFVNEHFAVVLDGATSKTDKKWDGKTPGRVATDCVLSILPFINPTTTAEKFYLACNEAIADWYKKNNVYIEMREHINQRPTVSIVVYSQHRRQVWCTGSGYTLFDNQYINNTKLVDTLNAEVRSYFIQCELKRGISEYELLLHDTGRKLVEPLIMKQQFFQNSDEPSEFNYYEIDGFFTQTSKIRITDIPPEVEELVLASDGYPEIFRTLEKTEKFLAALLKDDPLLYKKYKATKGLQQGNVSFDDRSYLRIKLD